MKNKQTSKQTKPQMPQFIRAYNHASILRTNEKNTFIEKEKKPPKLHGKMNFKPKQICMKNVS